MDDRTNQRLLLDEEKIEAAIHNEDWQMVIPNTPVAISIGWAELDLDVNAAFRTDRDCISMGTGRPTALE